MRIGILTGGGDVPGLNPSIKAVVERVDGEGHEVLGIRRGWGGLLEFDLDDPTPTSATRAARPRRGPHHRPHRWHDAAHVAHEPGRVRAKDMPAFLADQASGEEPYDFTPHVLRVLERLQLDALIAIGGDDTLSYARRLHEEGFAVIAIPKTMDNDVHGTDYCIGFSTASPAASSSSTSCGPRPVRTSGWPSSSCSAATRGRRRSSPPTSRASTVRSSPRCRSTRRSSLP
jgi:ATP-dependent phosphofructokinase / diphosphate-dependent phosphofructokinase